MIAIISQKFKEQYQSIIYYFIGLFAYSWMIMAIFPTMKKIDLESLYSQYPEEFLKFFGGDQMESMSKIEGFISMEFLSLFFILIVGFYVASSAGSIIAGTIEKKTMDFQLTQPISRTKLVISETVLGLLNSFLLTALTSFSIFVLGKAYNVDISNNGLLAFTAIATLMLWAFYGIALVLSSILKSKIVVAASTIFILMGFYVFSSMTRIVDKLADYEKYSIFYLYDPQKLLMSGTINTNHALILIFILMIGLFSSLIIFNKKDI